MISFGVFDKLMAFTSWVVGSIPTICDSIRFREEEIVNILVYVVDIHIIHICNNLEEMTSRLLYNEIRVAKGQTR